MKEVSTLLKQFFNLPINFLYVDFTLTDTFQNTSEAVLVYTYPFLVGIYGHHLLYHEPSWLPINFRIAHESTPTVIHYIAINRV